MIAITGDTACPHQPDRMGQWQHLGDSFHEQGKIVQRENNILTVAQVRKVFTAAMDIEKLMGFPQDIESWTADQAI